MNPSAAYRASYSTDNMSAAAISVEASRLKKHPKISLALQDARQQTSASALQEHIDNLEELKQAAIEANQLGPAVAAEEKKGRVQGLYVEKHEDVTKGDDRELLQAIEQLLGPEAARNAAKMLGLEDETEH